MAKPIREPRATKIVATIGPRAETGGELVRLLSAGVDVVRLNGAHCRPGDIARRVALVREAEKALGRPVGVLLDLGGPKIRVGPIVGDTTVWEAGDLVEIVPGRVPGSGRTISVTYPALLSEVAPGAEIRIADGLIRLKVEKRERGSLRARVLAGGTVRKGAGVNLPSSALSAPAVTPKDRRDLREGLEAGIQFVGLSFVRSVEHVKALRRLLAAAPVERRPWIVSKIERVEAVRALREIAAASDVLMVARGDLGVEIGLAAVPGVQRAILAVGREKAVPVIVATQMLESMVENPVPTRAEVSDVAGAVHDGADAVMLSGETAVGATRSRRSGRWTRSPASRRPSVRSRSRRRSGARRRRTTRPSSATWRSSRRGGPAPARWSSTRRRGERRGSSRRRGLACRSSRSRAPRRCAGGSRSCGTSSRSGSPPPLPWRR
jgi:pyruvate kinase